LKKFFIVAFIVAFVLKTGYDYLYSEDFQKYGDRTKAEWTCQVNNVMGNLNVVMSNYKEAYDLFDRVVKRCPDSPTREEAQFRMADCLTSLGRNADSIAAYEKYIEDFKGTKRASIAARSIQILKGNY
jgi:tetratricopeptide (TPR) repeat protein